MSRPPKYPSEAARREAIAASNRAKSARRAEADRLQLIGMVPPVFGSGDIGNALRAVGRHWGENAGVLQRGEKYGTMVQLDDKPQGHRMIRQWRFVEPRGSEG